MSLRCTATYRVECPKFGCNGCEGYEESFERKLSFDFTDANSYANAEEQALAMTQNLRFVYHPETKIGLIGLVRNGSAVKIVKREPSAEKLSEPIGFIDQVFFAPKN